jgi:NAD-dependent deacetylase
LLVAAATAFSNSGLEDSRKMIHNQEQIHQARALICKASRIVAFSGAGISTESGLADFRSQGGLWERYRIVTFQEFLACHESRVEYWSMRRELIPGLLAARPNPAHYALVKLEQTGQLRCVITQNIDGLHQSAGSQRVIELHGTNMTASCLNCHSQWPIAEIQQRLEAGDHDPHCTACHGLIKPDTVSFGQAMPVASMEDAYQEATACDLLLMIGSSLEVQPANQFPLVAHQRGAKLIFINRTATSYDHLAAVSFTGNAGRVLATLAE